MREEEQLRIKKENFLAEQKAAEARRLAEKEEEARRLAEQEEISR